MAASVCFDHYKESTEGEPFCVLCRIKELEKQVKELTSVSEPKQ